MNRHYWLLAILLLLSKTITADTPSDSELFNECDARCNALSGQSRYQCIKMCINAKKKNASPSGGIKNSRFNDCEDICSPYTGLDQIKCIRICLDEKQNREKAKKNAIKKDAIKKEIIDPCENRCGVLTGVLKEKCLMRCRKNNSDEYRDPLRYK